MDDDLVLLERWSTGDAAAGNVLFKRHFEAVYRFFENKAEGELDDLLQETFLACVKSRDSFRRQSSFRTYLLAIARHTLFGYWRRRAGNRTTPIDFDEISVASLSTSLNTRLSRDQERASLLAALRNLPLDQQLLLEMFYWEELDRDQLAEVFDVETATIGSRLFRARQALSAGLGGRAPALSDVTGEFDAWAREVGMRAE